MAQVMTPASLSMPSRELAEKCMRSLGTDERLTGLKMSLMGGSNPSPLYTLESAADFIRIGTYEEAMVPNSQSTVGYIDLEALAIWIRDMFGDQELADAIDELRASGEVYGVTADPARELLQTRVAQCGQVLSTEG